MDPVSDQRTERLTIAPLPIKWAVLVAAAGVVAYLCLLVVHPFFAVAAWSAVIAISCYPAHRRLVRGNGRVALSAAITSTSMVLAVLVPLLFVGGVAIKQLLTVGDWLRQAFIDPDGMSRRITEVSVMAFTDAVTGNVVSRAGLRWDSLRPLACSDSA
jgi:predicted PurR-regulated permease PerM